MTKANSQIGKIFTNIFSAVGQETDIASVIFYVDRSQRIKPTLHTYGDLDGGIAKLQILKSGLTEADADNTATSTDWKDSDDILADNSYSTIDYSRRPHRVKVSNSGASANYTADVIYNL